MDALQTAITALIGVAVAGLWAYLASFVKEQRRANRANTEFQRSQQRAEIMRAFQRHVEDGKAISPDELAHLEACYEAYHANGGNGTGTLMYERIKEHAVLVTRIGKKGE